MVTQERLTTETTSLTRLITLGVEWAQLKKQQLALSTQKALLIAGLMSGAFFLSLFLLLAAVLEIAKAINLALNDWLGFLDPAGIHLLSAAILFIATIVLLALLFKILRKVI